MYNIKTHCRFHTQSRTSSNSSITRPTLRFPRVGVRIFERFLDCFKEKQKKDSMRETDVFDVEDMVMMRMLLRFLRVRVCVCECITNHSSVS